MNQRDYAKFKIGQRVSRSDDDGETFYKSVVRDARPSPHGLTVILKIRALSAPNAPCAPM